MIILHYVAIIYSVNIYCTAYYKIQWKATYKNSQLSYTVLCNFTLYNFVCAQYIYIQYLSNS